MIIPFFIAAGVIALATAIVQNRVIDFLLEVLYLTVLTAFTGWVFLHPDESAIDGLFRADATARLFLAVMTAVSWPVCLYYWRYTGEQVDNHKAVAFHNGGTIFFLTAIAATLMAQHLWLLWACLEATTLGAGLMIYHDRGRVSLEATWKYLFVGSIGIALAFAGIMLLSLTGHNDAGMHDYSLQSLQANVGSLNPAWVKTAFLLILTGFSVKLGSAPLFNVDIDAKDAAPSSVGALFSSALMNVGFVSIFRVVNIFQGSGIESWMQNVLLLTGVFTVGIAAIYLQRVKRYKRLLAYSSMENAGIVLIALACGPLGFFAAMLHLVLHSFLKSGLFLQVGAMHRHFRGNDDRAIGHYLRTGGLGGAAMMFGTLALLALPPSGLFVSELLVFKSLLAQGRYVYFGILALLLTLVLYGVLRQMLRLFYAESRLTKPAALTQLQASYAALVPLLLMATMCALGYAMPDDLHNLLAEAAGLGQQALAATFSSHLMIQ